MAGDEREELGDVAVIGFEGLCGEAALAREMGAPGGDGAEEVGRGDD
jgi:hypothetical protein